MVNLQNKGKMTESERSNPFNESFDTNSAELPDGEGMGLSKAEQLSLAIRKLCQTWECDHINAEETKSLVIACPTTQVDRRRQLVGRLVQLRLQLSQLNDVVADGDEADAEKHTKICHHQFEVCSLGFSTNFSSYKTCAVVIPTANIVSAWSGDWFNRGTDAEVGILPKYFTKLVQIVAIVLTESV